MSDFWRERYSWMSEGQWKCFEMLCDLFGGAHHLSSKVKPHGSGIEINENAFGRFATFDFDHLTRGVVMAHDRAIRFAIEPSGPGLLKLILHFRGCRTGRMYQRHPTMEEAIETVRK
ncbi:hypothetical protein P3339_07970 [Microbulbifer sp. MLAF003]|uniref:hypothetical protein n=1 Tax=Microbulbifer sp. MLAF003 TaxID=3032582 RepID=UPI0024ADA4A4|nr:hypothetical protein [Microbulbifer sp. MLAF003]WHI52684.1 hypothetical protein P3339_07970 [Microbulbifer sp. MLAF003]